MSTLIKDIETFKKYVTVNFNFDIDQVMPYIRRKERKHIKTVLGSELYTAWATAAPTAEIEKQVFDLMQEASANLATFAFTFHGPVQMSNAGFHISTNQNSTPAEWWQIRDLRRDLLKAGNEAIDEALELMEANEGLFATWVGTDGYTHFKELFTRKTQTFQRYHNIENSRLTFLRLRPHLLKVENKFFKGLLGQETVDKIKAEATPEAKEALKLCQAAQVALCVSELANEGAFQLTPKGLFVETEEVPGDKRSAINMGDGFLFNLHTLKFTEGNEHLKELVAYLQQNETAFPEFAAMEVKTATSTAYNTKSTLSI